LKRPVLCPAGKAIRHKQRRRPVSASGKLSPPLILVKYIFYPYFFPVTELLITIYITFLKSNFSSLRRRGNETPAQIWAASLHISLMRRYISNNVHSPGWEKLFWQENCYNPFDHCFYNRAAAVPSTSALPAEPAKTRNPSMKFGIEKKIILPYLPIFLVIIAIAALSSRSLNELNLINRSIIEEDAFLVQAAGKMEDALLAQESYGRRYLILNSREMLDLFRQRDREFNELADGVRALPHPENIPIEQLITLHAEFNALYTGAAEAIDNPPLPVTEEFEAQVRDTFDRMMALLQQIIQFGKQNQFRKMEEANRIGIRSFQITALLAVLGIIVGLGAASLITRSLAGTINRLKQATEIISEGRYDNCPQIDTRDELGELAGSLRLMALSLSRLEQLSLDSSPLTRMPGGMAVENTLSKRLQESEKLAFCIMDLDNFKSYNDRYGYAKGNEVIRATAAIIESAVREHGGKEDFIGHIGGDDFAVITDTETYEAICRTIIKRFDETVISFYNETDRARGYITTRNRQGRPMTFPVMSLSIAVVTTDRNRRMNHIEVGEIAAELKTYAKSLPGSVLVTDRRGKFPDAKSADYPPLRVIQ
jgi:diguanylate cyclase (GGDEF)-like protein